MAINPNISLQAAEQPVVADPAGAYLNAQQHQQQRQLTAQHLQAGAMQLQEQQRQMTEAQKLRDIFAQTPDVRAALPKVFAVNPQVGISMQKSLHEQEKAELERKKLELENNAKKAERFSSIAGTIKDEPSYHAGIVAATGEGLITPEHAQQLFEQGWNPQTQAQVEQIVQAGIGAKDQAELNFKKLADERAALEAKHKREMEPYEVKEKQAQADARAREDFARANPTNEAAQQAAMTAEQRAQDARAKAKEDREKKYQQAVLGIQRQRLALEGGTTVMVPNKEGGYTATRVKPGDQVPEGAVTAAGMSSQNTPTAASRSMMEAAPKVEGLVSRVEQLINEQEKDLGPGSSRFNEFLAGKVGAKNKEYTKLRTDIGLLQTALMRMHVGARGGTEMMKHFSDLIDASKQDPDNLRAALGEIRAYANTVQGKHTETSDPAKRKPLSEIFK